MNDMFKKLSSIIELLAAPIDGQESLFGKNNMPESIKRRTDYLDTVRSLILLHPAGYRDGQPMIPTFHRPGKELSED